VTARRPELLAALLTIWRWGRQTPSVQGTRLGASVNGAAGSAIRSLPLVVRIRQISEAKERDEHRQVIADLFRIWWKHHREPPVAVRQLRDDIKQVLDQQGHDRQYLAAKLRNSPGRAWPDSF
jgi:hypothetical protein